MHKKHAHHRFHGVPVESATFLDLNVALIPDASAAFETV
jgi:hypothetical protein